MPRPSYEQHRAGKAATAVALGRRRGSMVESETDAESLASFSTHLTDSSHTYYPPPTRLSATPNQHQQHLPFPGIRQRTFSSTSRESSATYSPAPSSPSAAVSAALGVRDGIREKERAERRERREQRRKEKERKSTLVGDKYDSPLRRWLRWMSRSGLSAWSLPVGLAAVLVVKAAVGLGGFSGKDSPPMFGDFEAQRHWMELTLHLPMREWYTFSPEWWQLDYPPLSAYASWLCGRLGAALDPTHFALDVSRGLSPPALITYLRASVLTFEALVWWSAVVAYMVLEGRKGGRSWRSQMTGIMTVLLQPSLALIDNGHFQYNSVLLGLSLWAVIFLKRGQDVAACIAFSLALCFKQMGLYYAPAIGCYLLGKCIHLNGSKGILHLVKLGVATIATFALMFAPWISTDPQHVLWVVHRIFPLARGLFEDKVANFWCASNVAIKWRTWFSVTGLARVSLLVTLVALLPTIIILLYSSFNLRVLSVTPREASGKPKSATHSLIHTSGADPAPTATLLPVALFTSSMSFFLLSFQVHEKSILLPLMPLTIMMSLRGGKEGSARTEEEIWDWGVLLNNVAVFSMWPLLVRDGQALQYVTVTLLWNYVIGYSPFAVEGVLLRTLGLLVYAGIAIIHALDSLPIAALHPARFPDLYVVLNVLLSFGVFGVAWLWATRKLVEGAWAMGGLSATTTKSIVKTAG